MGPPKPATLLGSPLWETISITGTCMDFPPRLEKVWTVQTRSVRVSLEIDSSSSSRRRRRTTRRTRRRRRRRNSSSTNNPALHSSNSRYHSSTDNSSSRSISKRRSEAQVARRRALARSRYPSSAHRKERI